jgi:hypothetical protein
VKYISGIIRIEIDPLLNIFGGTGKSCAIFFVQILGKRITKIIKAVFIVRE